jgi:hypothetical protein
LVSDRGSCPAPLAITADLHLPSVCVLSGVVLLLLFSDSHSCLVCVWGGRRGDGTRWGGFYPSPGLVSE